MDGETHTHGQRARGQQKRAEKIRPIARQAGKQRVSGDDWSDEVPCLTHVRLQCLLWPQNYVMVICASKSPPRGGWTMQLQLHTLYGRGEHRCTLTLLQVSVVGFLEESTGPELSKSQGRKRGAAGSGKK